MNNIAIRTSAKPFIDRVKFPYGFKKSGDFSISEANLLSLYGRTLNALETGELQAESEDEKHFVDFISGRAEAINPVEKSMGKVCKALSWQKNIFIPCIAAPVINLITMTIIPMKSLT